MSARKQSATNGTGAHDGAPSAAEFIRIRGARVHNLKNLDIDIPRDRLVVVTGPSGSGKSSLAFDTVYAEGQRQYIESLSVYARQFLHQMERPDVDLIEGLQPTISIDQRVGSRNPRSTVATVTEIYDHLRLFMARLGEASCYRCGMPIRQQSPQQIQERVMELPAGTKVMVMAPMVRGRKGLHEDVFATIRKAGLIRARVDGEVIDVEKPPALAPRKNHDIEAVVDRIVLRSGIEERLAESLRLAITHGEGAVLVSHFERESEDSTEGTWHEQLYSTRYACPNCKIGYEELDPRTFSFNSPYGACPTCQGLGVVATEPAIEPNDESVGGSPDNEEESAPNGNGAARSESDLSHTKPCPDCGGARLRPEARSVRLGGLAIHEITALSATKARDFFRGLKFTGDDRPVAQPIISEIANRLEFLNKIGLEYLTLDRPADTLSGGELQRVRLARGIGSGLVGVCYVLDEPSIGLHPRDNQRLIDALRGLQQQGNTVLVVEHDDAVMRQADLLIDLGPGAGRHGGEVVSQGRPDQVTHDPQSVTGRYLSGELSIPVPSERRRIAASRSLTIEDVTTNNLKHVSAKFPLSALVCVTGVSGSGKSSLLNETLARAVTQRLTGGGPTPGPFASLRGVNQIDKLVEIDQSAIGRTPRSNPATYTGAFDEIRKVFATTREARQRGYKAGRFSFNAKGGRCEACQGHGVRKIEMNFLPDLFVTCEECHGQRFNRQTLEIRYRDKSIADVLNLRVEDAVTFFENHPVVHRLLTGLMEVGLGYLTLGQSAITMSGGEAQRIKLATELSRTDTGRSLYLLDEPTTGLHFDDIRQLLLVLNRLVDLGNTVIVIEHNLDVMKSADWIVDLGPEGGERGGEIVATGTPEQIAATKGNYTGQFLRPLLTEKLRTKD